ncbi:F-box/WD repeat-containing protein 9 [Nymphon striatum]|nr:F-box/WD repeat-containing protein 9 [Nymphon striatum]
MSDDKSNLYSIPVEIFTHICSFLDAKFIVDVLGKVCVKFLCILSDEGYWKVRMRCRWTHRYPDIVKDNEDFDWEDACYKRETHDNLWKSPHSKVKEVLFPSSHSSSVHTISFIPGTQLCASGSSDRTIIIWQIDEMKNTEKPLAKDVVSVIISAAHSGWIWSLSADGSNLYSAGWDGCVKCWNLSTCPSIPTFCLWYDFTNLYAISIIYYKSPVISTYVYKNMLASGTWNKTVYLHDLRTSTNVSYNNFHDGGVLSVVLDDQYLISSGEDTTVVIYDRVAGRIYDRLKMPSAPLSMSYNYGILWIGDAIGNVYAVDPKLNNNKILVVNSYHQTKVNAIKHTLGSVITGSFDNRLTFHEPTLEGNFIGEYELRTLSEIESIDVNDENVVAATAGNQVYFLIPQEDS